MVALSAFEVPSAVREAMRQHDEYAAAVAAEAQGHEKVLFTASHPDVLTFGIRRPLYVHVYREDIRAQLNERLSEIAGRLGLQWQYGEDIANTMIPPGAEIEIRPVIANVRSHPARREIKWQGEFSEARFEIECTSRFAVGGRCAGSIVISVSGAVVAQPPVSVAISDSRDDSAALLQTVTTGMNQSVFGSYAREDAEIVRHFREVYRGLNIALFVDTLDMPGGVAWKRYLEERIAGSDLFQLFWSSASAASKAVEREWRHALTVADRRPPGTEFIVPVYWKEPCPAKPERLSHLNFRRLDLRHYGYYRNGAFMSAVHAFFEVLRSAFTRGSR
jgi:hypothetical protein